MPISKIKTSSILADAASTNLNIDAGTLFLDATNNRVGVGTTSPYRQLQIGDYSTNAVMALGSSATSTGTFCFASSDSAPGRYVGTIAYDHQANAMIFGVNAVEAIRIDSSGKVGIGETSPTQILHLKGSSTAYGLAETTGTGTSSGFRMKAGASADYTLFTTQGTNQFAIYDNAAGLQRLTITSAGAIGIGTSSPVSGRRLTVATTGTDSAVRIDAPTGYQSYLELTENGSLTSGNYWQIGKIATTNALQFWNGTERMRISSAGKVGIGLTNPSAPLHVSGIVSDSLTASSSNFKLSSGGGDGIAMGSFQAAPFGSWIQSGYLVDGYNPPFNNGYPLILNPSGGGVVIGADTSVQYGARLYVNGAVACRHSGVDSSPLPAWTAGYTSNYTEKNIISTSVSSSAGNSGFYFYVSDGAGSANTTLSLRVNRGSCQVIGSLSKGSGSFKIDHPLPEKENTHHLVHSFIEGPQADLIYRGKVVLVNGRADVNVDIASGMTDGTFVVLCREVQCFTTNETGWAAVRGKVTGNMLTIEAQDNTCTDEISWMVIGERQDKHMIDTGWTDENGKVIVEPEKPAINAPKSAIIPEPEELNLDSEPTSTDGE